MERKREISFGVHFCETQNNQKCFGEMKPNFRTKSYSTPVPKVSTDCQVSAHRHEKDCST